MLADQPHTNSSHLPALAFFFALLWSAFLRLSLFFDDDHNKVPAVFERFPFRGRATQNSCIAVQVSEQRLINASKN
jgi:hypothetical protein